MTTAASAGKKQDEREKMRIDEVHHLFLKPAGSNRAQRRWQ